MGLFKFKPKSADSDFKQWNLPRNRKDQFFDIFKNNLSLYFKIGGILFLFALPFLVLLAFKYFYLGSAYSSLTTEEFESFKQMTEIIYRAIFVAALMIFSIGFAGVLQILKHVIWQEPVFFFHDFKKGIKDNIVRFLIVSFVVGVFEFGGYLAISFYKNIPILGYVPTALNLVIIFPVALVFAYVNSYYKNTFLRNITLSFEIYFKSFPRQLLNFLLIYVFTFVKYIPLNSIILVLIICIITFFYTPVWLFITYLNQVSIFDRHINSQCFPDMVFRGLYTGNHAIEKQRKNKKKKVKEKK